jgi:F-type H+-transporting ATPase subunit gamma
LEPDIDGILAQIIPKYISMKLRLIILESFTSEHSARVIAMKTATDNAKDLLQNLVVLRNKVRQASITQDLMEIISSTEALRG